MRFRFDIDIDESEVPTNAPSLVNVCASAFEVMSQVVNVAINIAE